MDILYKYLNLRAKDLTIAATIIASNSSNISFKEKEIIKPIEYTKETQIITLLNNPDILLQKIQSINTINITINKLKEKDNLLDVLDDDEGKILLFVLLRDYATF